MGAQVVMFEEFLSPSALRKRKREEADMLARGAIIEAMRELGHDVTAVELAPLTGYSAKEIALRHLAALRATGVIRSAGQRGKTMMWRLAENDNVVRLPIATYLVRGLGERLDCRHYDRCLAGFARAHAGHAHCPKACPHFEAADHRDEDMLVATAQRDDAGYGDNRVAAARGGRR